MTDDLPWIASYGDALKIANNFEGGAGFLLFSCLPGGAVELPGRSRPAPGVVAIRRGDRKLARRMPVSRLDVDTVGEAVPVIDLFGVAGLDDWRHAVGNEIAGPGKARHARIGAPIVPFPL